MREAMWSGAVNATPRQTQTEGRKGAATRGGTRILGPLAASSRAAGLGSLAERFETLAAWLDDDLQALESALGEARAERREEPFDTLARRAARHLLDQPGKRVRPLCVLLASRLGEVPPASRAVRDLAAAAELAHAATLLHDDVIDLGDERRGASTARVLYGNPASVLGGDHVLVDALRRVDRAGVPGAMTELIDVIDRMVAAEALQLERRGAADLCEPEEAQIAWRRVADGKTGALFAWALRAGGRAANLPDAAVERLGAFGALLGEAFQLADDALDLDGDPALTGKDAFADLREGKPTWPIAFAVARDPSLGAALREVAQQPPHAVEPATLLALRDRILRTGAVPATWRQAEAAAERAVALLQEFPNGPARDALVAVVRAAARRSH
ncbi:MAG: polyprenyl synthetase family protein [Deltaproteobacteria bacterium]|nr:polyprenyl synthetase family protein [Deltaproteobacteria bacterium]